MRPTDLLDIVYPYITNDVSPIFANHNWDNDFIETWSWKTDILKAWDSSEQRIKLRHPRRTWEYKITASNDNRRKLETIIGMRTPRYVFLPVWRDAVHLISGLSSGSTIVSCPTTYSEFLVDGFVSIWDSFDHYEIRKINSVGSASITLDYATTESFEAGAMIAPCLFGFARPQKRIDRFTENVADYSFTVDVLFSPTIGDMISPTTYNGLTVCPFQPSWNGDQQEDIINAWTRLDRETGIIEYEVTAEEPEYSRTANFLISGRANIDIFIRFIHAMAGMLTPFYISANERGVELAASASAGAEEISIKNIGYTNDLFGANSRSVLYFQKTNGSIFYREIEGSSEDGENEILTLDSSLPSDISAATLNRLTWFEKVRFASDDIQLKWIAHDCFETSIPIAVLI